MIECFRNWRYVMLCIAISGLFFHIITAAICGGIFLWVIPALSAIALRLIVYMALEIHDTLIEPWEVKYGRPHNQ